MPYEAAYRYRFYPTPGQKYNLARTFGCVRYVYNRALEIRSNAYHEEGQTLRYGDTSSMLTDLKQKGSNNWHKQRRKVARIYAKITDRRTDYLHKLTSRLVRENQVIVVETLRVQNMMKNRCLARSISDVGWGELVRQLGYKCEWYGRELVRIDQWYPSSQRCSDCGHVKGEMSLDVREWICPECGEEHDRDVNAAVNILRAGQARLASGDDVRPIASSEA